MIPDIEFTVGWWEAGVNTICFYSRSLSERLTGICLASVVSKVFPELADMVDAPYGAWMTRALAEQVEDRLRKLREGK